MEFLGIISKGYKMPEDVNIVFTLESVSSYFKIFL